MSTSAYTRDSTIQAASEGSTDGLHETDSNSDSGVVGVSNSRRVWSVAEDERLRLAVAKYGSSRGPGSAWGSISQCVGGTRTNKDCRKRWFHSLDPALKKGKWSREEDDRLREMYTKLGPKWKEIALRIPGRKDDQVSKRWRDVVCPELTPNKPWTVLEDALLLQLYDKHGPKWTTIAEHLPGRSPTSCRNRSRKYQMGVRGPNSFSHSADDDEMLDDSTDPLFPVDSTSSSRLTTCTMDDDIPANPFDFDWSVPLPVMNAPVDSDNVGFDQLFDLTMKQPSELPQPPATLTAASAHIPVPLLPSDNDHILPSVASPTLFDQWLAAMANGDQPVPAPNIWASSPSSHFRPNDEVDNPVNNAWSLCVALQSGRVNVTVSADFLRKLVADAARNT